MLKTMFFIFEFAVTWHDVLFPYKIILRTQKQMHLAGIEPVNQKDDH